MKAKTLTLWTFGLIAISALGSAAQADSGPPTYYPDRDTVIVDGKPVTLHDLGLTQKTLNQVIPTGAVAAYIKQFADDLAKFGGNVNFYNFERDLTDPVSGQYVIVSHLPDHCIFTPPENLPPGVQTANVGCTQDKITYLVPDYIRKMDDVQKALLFIHERLHALSALESFEVKTDIVKAANVLLTRYHPAIANPPSSFAYTADELAVLNRLTTRLSQIANSAGVATNNQQIWPIQFVASGGYIQAPQISVDAQDLTITPGSSIYLASPVHIHGTGLHLLKNSSILTQVCCSATPSGPAFELTFNDVTITNSKVDISYAYSLTLTHATITDSSVFLPDHQNISNLVVNKSQLDDQRESVYTSPDNVECKTPITDIHFENVRSFQGFICASQVDIENSDRLENLNLTGSAITVTGSTVSQANLIGNRITVKDSSLEGSSYSGDDIHVESSRVQRSQISAINHFTQIATTLHSTEVLGYGSSTQNVTLDQAELEGQYDDDVFQVTFYSSVTLGHASIHSVHAHDNSDQTVKVSFGIDGQTTVLDGRGNTYNLNSCEIRNQADLDQSLNPPKPGKKS